MSSLDHGDDDFSSVGSFATVTSYVATKTKRTFNIVAEYCNASSIHGIRYLAEPGRPFIERLFWGIAFVASIYVCVTNIVGTWYKWDDTPVIVGFSEKERNVYEVPFPAVTICPESKAIRSIFNFSHNLHLYSSDPNNLTRKQKIRLEALSQICNNREYTFGNLSGYTNVANLLNRMVPNILSYASWRNEEVNLKKNFAKVLTDEGICYMFNSVNPQRIFRRKIVNKDLLFEEIKRKKITWTLDDGYDENAYLQSYPERTFAGGRGGLIVELKSDMNDYDFDCQREFQGFKIYLHTPGELPKLTGQYFRATFEKELFFMIRPEMFVTSKRLLSYKPKKRNCYFQNERYLENFQIYTQKNCEIECLTNYTLRLCGCVRFSMPRKKFTPICSGSKRKCFLDSETNLLIGDFENGMDLPNKTHGKFVDCNCLPTCTTISYNVEISQADYRKYQNSTDIDVPVKYSQIKLVFKQNTFMATQRLELYGTTDFMASCGGLLGLFMGFSALSIVEIIYFATIRFVNNFLRSTNRKDEKNNS